jgi:hypothetical protein
MSRTVLPFAATDMSALARSLGRELAACAEKPGHVQLLNMLARATGYRNFQHYRAQLDASGRLTTVAPTPDPVDHLLVERVARHFDGNGLFLRWPSKTSHQALALWCLWARMPAGCVLREKDVNAILKANHLFGDHVLLRRELCDYQMLARTADCREYRRIERRPPPEALGLIQHVGARQLV